MLWKTELIIRWLWQGFWRIHICRRAWEWHQSYQTVQHWGTLPKPVVHKVCGRQLWHEKLCKWLAAKPWLRNSLNKYILWLHCFKRDDKIEFMLDNELMTPSDLIWSTISMLSNDGDRWNRTGQGRLKTISFVLLIFNIILIISRLTYPNRKQQIRLTDIDI